MDDDEVSVLLPPGFRFYPTQEELVSFYLHNKLNGTRPDIHTVIPVVRIYDHNPWDLPKFCGGEDDEQWFFFNPRQEREARGGKTNRRTTAGYWKATGSPSNVYSNNNNNNSNNNSAIIIGTKRTMVFYVGKAPNGTKTIWKMNEYKAVDFSSDQASSPSSTVADHRGPRLREEVSLCRIYTGSRSTRAFDRRPIIATEVAAAAVHHHCDGSSSSSSPAAQNPFQSVEINGNGTNTSAVALESDDGGEPCWDSELFNSWFCK